MVKGALSSSSPPRLFRSLLVTLDTSPNIPKAARPLKAKPASAPLAQCANRPGFGLRGKKPKHEQQKSSGSLLALFEGVQKQVKLNLPTPVKFYAFESTNDYKEECVAPTEDMDTSGSESPLKTGCE